MGDWGTTAEVDGASCAGTGAEEDVEERRVSGRARPWRARRASMAVNAEVGGSQYGKGRTRLVGRPWEDGPGKSGEGLVLE